MAELALLGGPPEIDKPLTPYNSIGSKEAAAVAKVIDSGVLSGFIGAPGAGFLGGPQVRSLEDAWCTRFSVKHAVSVNSATSGLFAAMGAAGIGQGDEVIVPPYTMSATAVAPLVYGGVPVFVDIEDSTFCLDLAAVEDAITPRTKAIIAVNLFGHPAPLAALRHLADARGLILVEDNAQAPLASEKGKLAGTIGHIGVFSLNRHKHIQSGEGGICVTDDDALATKLQLIRNHGENLAESLGDDDMTNLIGFNYRLTELSAAIGHCQLESADEIVTGREARATRLSQLLRGTDGLTVPAVRDDCRHTYYVWAATLNAEVAGIPRSLFAEAVRAEGVPLHEGYVRPLYHLPLFRNRMAMNAKAYPSEACDRSYRPESHPVCESLYNDRLVWFGICDYALENDGIDRVAAAISKVCEGFPALSAALRSGHLDTDAQMPAFRQV
jgi:perosamine synthetase